MHLQPKLPRTRDIPGVLFVVLLAALFVVLLRHGAWVQPDSGAYLDDAPIVGPGYPFFLRIHRWVFGGRSLGGVVFSQLLLGFGVSLWLARSLGKHFALPRYVTGVLTFVLLLPYLSVTHFGNAIMSEALAYPLFLIVVRYLVDGLLDEKAAPLVKAFLWSAVLILTRKQFVVFYPLFAMVLGYGWLVKRGGYRRGTVLVFLVVVLATQLAERGWQYARDGHFASVPFSGFLLVTAPLFVSHPGDASVLETNEQRLIFEETRTRLAAKGLLPGGPRTGREHLFLQSPDLFDAAYNAICWGTLLPTLREHEIVDWYQIDAMTRSMARRLIRANLRDYLKFYRLNVVRGAGGNALTIFLFAFMLMALGFHAVHRDSLSLVAAAVSILTVGNLMVVALAEPTLPRYLAYTENVQICIYMIVAVEGFRGRLSAHRA